MFTGHRHSVNTKVTQSCDYVLTPTLVLVGNCRFVPRAHTHHGRPRENYRRCSCEVTGDDAVLPIFRHAWRKARHKLKRKNLPCAIFLCQYSCSNIYIQVQPICVQRWLISCGSTVREWWLSTWRYNLHLWPRVWLCSIYEDCVFSGLQQGCALGSLHLMDSLPMAKEPRALEFGLRFFLSGSTSSSKSLSLCSVPCDQNHP